MKTSICEQLGIDVPVFAFTHSPDVVIAVSNAGGMGVLGAAGMGPEKLDQALQKITEACPGKSFGVDLILPNNYVGKEQGGLDVDSLKTQIPEAHKSFLEDLLKQYDVGEIDADQANTFTSTFGQSVTYKGARTLAEIALSYPIKLLVNALGTFPAEFREKAYSLGIKTGALVGQVKHAIRQKEAGVDVIIAQGYEAGGHTGDIATMALVPQVVDAVAPIPVLAAGGIADGRQLAAALALGAQGAWTGSVWLMSKEAETHPVVKEKFKEADASQTLRSRSTTGKHARQLRSAWTDAWENPDNPNPLPMPLHSMLIDNAQRRIKEDANQGRKGGKELINYFVSQNVGLFTEERPAADILDKMVKECGEVLGRIGGLANKKNSI